MSKGKTIPQDVLSVLAAGRCEGVNFYLPAGQLDRKLYVAVNDVLAALGGKWNRKAGAHVFAEDCGGLIGSAVDTGSYTRPQDMGWFPTPAALAARVAELAEIEQGHVVLEPSAGEGALVAEIVKRGGQPHCYEIDHGRAAKLPDGSLLAVSDFLSVPPAANYDRVLMNPPFAARADIHHVTHARKFLKPGGKLVAIMSAGVAFREDSLAKAFREQCASIEHLPEGAFKESGTDVRTVVVVMEAA